jgi:hypothetical protein
MRLLSPTPASEQLADFESKTALAMAEAAATFLASLTADQKSLALYPLTDAGRLRWDYRPRLEKDGRNYLHFAWAGAQEPGKPHYL